MRQVVNRVKVLIFGLGCLLMMHTGEAQAQEAAKHYQKDFIQHVYDSAQGIEGSSANCILSDTEGLLWIGSYTGLFSYDSQEFRSYPIEDHAISVNALVQMRQEICGSGRTETDCTAMTEKRFRPAR